MTAEIVAPAWMHEQITAEEYESWSEGQCAGIEIVDGMAVVSPSASKRHNRLARIVANALDAVADAEWNADTDFDVRLQDVPLTTRRPDDVVCRADTINITPAVPVSFRQPSWGTLGRVTGTTVRRASRPLKSSGLVVKRGRSSATAMAAIIRSATRRGLRPALITAAQIRP